jgi:L-lactate utilization protein LutC
MDLMLCASLQESKHSTADWHSQEAGWAHAAVAIRGAAAVVLQSSKGNEDALNIVSTHDMHSIQDKHSSRWLKPS